MIKVTSLAILMLAMSTITAAQAEEKNHARSIKITWQNATKFAYEITFSGKNNCVIDAGRKNTFTVPPRTDSSTTIQIDERCGDEAEISWGLVTHNDSDERIAASVTYAELKMGASWQILVSAFSPHDNILFEAFFLPDKINCFKSTVMVNNINNVTSVVINLIHTGH
ncbi:hypothetical protein [Paraburkholderia humisilvae]|uniref:Uncharacterized protein n=1 Tax=Paraburkholderia humisilvae TaxID=627669 RepID=A0A6J5F8G0_9BURK|nr:hypothetical protein [Paraburkholderia humisilvae]CAB3775120.1 hypothetical protein LMG29542_08502 [Paraburkholderia humisilvae]